MSRSTRSYLYFALAVCCGFAVSLAPHGSVERKLLLLADGLLFAVWVLHVLGFSREDMPWHKKRYGVMLRDMGSTLTDGAPLYIKGHFRRYGTLVEAEHHARELNIEVAHTVYVGRHKWFPCKDMSVEEALREAAARVPLKKPSSNQQHPRPHA